ncbi:MAG: glycerophosphoryl diester phosphodiesterase membrane domain-containing protein [Eubacterium sp.]|nr:glycerophosphoryl diester phosphodiesterase membrane domain-containing protein [Eubacterium sp.]
MKGLKETIKLIRRNALSIMVFELLMRLISYAALIPMLYALVNVAVKCAGLDYLYKANIATFFKAPTTYLFFILILLIYAFMNFMNISGVIVAIDCSRRGRRITLPRLFFKSLKRAVWVLRPRNLGIMFTSLLILPLSSLALTSFSLLNIKIPGYIVSYLKRRQIVINGVMIGYGVISLLSMGLIFMLHFYVLKKYSFKKAAGKSLEMIKKGGFRKVLGIIFVNVIVIATIFFLSGYMSELLLKLLKLISGAKSVNYLIYKATVNVNSFFYLIFVFLVFPILFGYISVQYYNILDMGGMGSEKPVEASDSDIDDMYEDGERKTSGKKRLVYRKPDPRVFPERARLYERAVFIMILLIVLVLDGTYYVLVRGNVISLRAANLNTAIVTAHRGDAKHAPENTLAAFDLAIENGADVIELDVRETLDGEIVVFHDKNISRVTGIDANVEEMTFEELRSISASGKFEDRYPDEKIPTLREAIELVGDRADLNIELKPDNSNTHLEEAVAALVEEYDLFDRCVVTSLSYKAIRKIKLIDDRIKTVYVMSVAGGNYYDLKYADAYSINYKYVDNVIVRNIHRRGKEVYVWTINNKTNLENMMLLDVDNIITDDPGMVKDSMYETYSGGLFSYIVRRFAFK